MNISVIIVNYNTAALPLNCVDSIVEHTQGVSYEIIVVDNHSDEADVVLLRNDSRLQLLEQPENMGFGRANNIGARKASGEHMLLLNPDTRLVNDAITILYNYLEEHPNTGVCGGNILDAEGQPAHSYHMLLPSILSEMDFACGQLYRRLRYGRNAQYNHTGSPLRVAMITGADMMVRRSAWEETAGFDSAFFMYCEDADLCLRIQKQGYAIESVPQAQIIHLEGKSFVETQEHCRRSLQGRFTYFRKHYSTTYNVIADTLNLLTLLLATVICTLTLQSGPKHKYRQRLRLYWQMAYGRAPKATSSTHTIKTI